MAGSRLEDVEYSVNIYSQNAIRSLLMLAKGGGMEIATCVSCGMEIERSSHYMNLCRECERSMSEEEIFAIMDAR